MSTDNREIVKIIKNFYKIGNYYYGCKHKGRTRRKKCPMQGILAFNNGKITTECRKWLQNWILSIENESYLESKTPKKTKKALTIFSFIESYQIAAEKEYILTKEPSPRRAACNVWSLERLCRTMGIDINEPLTVLTPKVLEDYVVHSIQRGLKRVSVYSSMANIRSLFSTWALRYYEHNDLDVTIIKVPRPKRNTPLCYERPPEALRKRTIEWYRDLEESHPEGWVLATLMLQFGCRNGDCFNITWSNIKPHGRDYMLEYKPNKVLIRTGRTITWPMSSTIYEKLRLNSIGNENLLTSSRLKLEGFLNSQMRLLGWTKDKYNKGLYELRKMCIDTVYTKLGAEKASQISGDNITTVCTYYADPCRSDVEAVDLTKLMV